MIEQGAIFEGSCKMLKAAEKAPKVERKENVIDASKLDVAKKVESNPKPVAATAVAS